MNHGNGISISTAKDEQFNWNENQFIVQRSPLHFSGNNQFQCLFVLPYRNNKIRSSIQREPSLSIRGLIINKSVSQIFDRNKFINTQDCYTKERGAKANEKERNLSSIETI